MARRDSQGLPCPPPLSPPPPPPSLPSSVLPIALYGKICIITANSTVASFKPNILGTFKIIAELAAVYFRDIHRQISQWMNSENGYSQRCLEISLIYSDISTKGRRNKVVALGWCIPQSRWPPLCSGGPATAYCFLVCIEFPDMEK